MDEDNESTAYPVSLGQFDISIIHSGSDVEIILEDFIRKKTNALGLSCGPMNYDQNEEDSAIFNDNLKTIKHSSTAVLLFSQNINRQRRCRFERLFALHLHSRFKCPKVIPVVIGNIAIPEKYAVFKEVFVQKNNRWCSNLLRALTQGMGDNNRVFLDDNFVNEGREAVEANIDTEKIEGEADDFDEFGTAFDTICFHFLDEFMRDTYGEPISDNPELNEICELQAQLCEKLESSSLKTRMEFLRMNSSSGVFSYIGQMGLNNIHKLLMEGCGMTVSNDIISLRWKTFEQNLLCSTITLADIVNFSKFVGIKRISIKFDKATHDSIERHYGSNWQELLVMFAERILKHRFTSNSDKEMLTYHVNINGIAGAATLTAINRTGRNIFLERFKEKCQDFQKLENRLQTFRNWPSDKKANPLNLAKAGFIYSGHEDTVTCFSCNQSLYGHVRVLGRSSSDHTSHIKNIVNHFKWNENCVFLESLPCYKYLKELSNSYCYVGVHYQRLSDRLKTFDSKLPKLRCLEFAKAGFIQVVYETNNLSIACVSCSTYINAVKLSQDPWIEHLRWSPKCEFVLKQKGRQFVDGALKVIAAEGGDDVFTEVIIETFLMTRTLSAVEESPDGNRQRVKCIDCQKPSDIELD